MNGELVFDSALLGLSFVAFEFQYICIFASTFDKNSLHWPNSFLDNSYKYDFFLDYLRSTTNIIIQCMVTVGRRLRY